MKRILLVEENGNLKKTFDSSPKSGDWEILVPRESSKNLRWIFDAIPDLIVADITSMKDSTVELLLYLNNELFSSIPFLLITSNRKIENSEFYKTGIYYLIRPYKTAQLIDRIDEILRKTETKNPW